MIRYYPLALKISPNPVSEITKIKFAIKQFFYMKLFRSNNTEIIAECRRYFQFNLPSELVEKKKTRPKFEKKLQPVRSAWYVRAS